MTFASSAYLLLLLAAGFNLARREYLQLMILAVPIVFCGYFIVSIFLFSFGEVMPFNGFVRLLCPAVPNICSPAQATISAA